MFAQYPFNPILKIKITAFILKENMCLSFLAFDGRGNVRIKNDFMIAWSFYLNIFVFLDIVTKVPQQ